MSDKITVLHITSNLDKGGTPKSLELFCEKMNKNYFDVIAAGFYEGGIREQLLKEHDITTLVFHGDQNRLYEFMKSEGIDVVHIYRAGVPEPAIIEAASKAQVPIIIETNVFGIYDPSPSGRAIDKHLIISKTAALKYMQRGKISFSDFLKEARVLYFPVDIDRFKMDRPTEEEIARFKAKIGVKEDEYLIARIGRSEKYRYCTLPVDMMHSLLKKIRKVKYLMIEEIPPDLWREIQRRGLQEHFISLPHQFDQELLKTYYTIDLLAYSSIVGESFGLTIAEAMAAGKPVVANSTPGADNAQIELVDHGKTGFIANTPKTYAEAVLYLLQNPSEAKKMGEFACKKVEELYDANKLVRVLERIYLELAVKKGLISAVPEYYKNIEIYPSDQELGDYQHQYTHRLSMEFGNPSLLQRSLSTLKYRWLFKVIYYIRYRLYKGAFFRKIIRKILKAYGWS